MHPTKKKMLQTGGVLGGTFVIGIAFIFHSFNSNPEGINEKLNEEASKASVAERLRANSLKAVELGQAKISDAETQKLENKNKRMTEDGLNNNLDTPKYQENFKGNEDEKKRNSRTISPWDVALSGKQPVDDPNPEQHEMDQKEDSSKNNPDSIEIKDAQNFVNYVSTPGLVHDAVVKKVDAPSKNESATTFHSNQTSVTPGNQSSNKIEIPMTKFARLASMGSEKLSVLIGKEQVAGRGQMFKAGTRVYALLSDKLTVTSGEKLDTSLIAFGSTEQKFPDNVTFVGQAQLNKSNRRVEILIDKCVNTRDDSPPLPCKAIVKDIMGDNGLSGKIYDPANWQLLIATAGTFLSTYVLGSLTTMVAQTGVTVDATVANQVRQALASSVNSIATRLSDSINKSGTEITISPGAVVQIFFVDTTTTWNLSSN